MSINCEKGQRLNKVEANTRMLGMLQVIYKLDMYRQAI